MKPMEHTTKLGIISFIIFLGVIAMTVLSSQWVPSPCPDPGNYTCVKNHPATLHYITYTGPTSCPESEIHGFSECPRNVIGDLGFFIILILILYWSGIIT
jgi:hypothetical protein